MPILAPTIIDGSILAIPVAEVGVSALAAAVVFTPIGTSIGTCRIVAAQIYCPGAAASQVFVPGVKAGEVFIPGTKAGVIVS